MAKENCNNLIMRTTDSGLSHGNSVSHAKN